MSATERAFTVLLKTVEDERDDYKRMFNEMLKVEASLRDELSKVQSQRDEVQKQFEQRDRDTHSWYQHAGMLKRRGDSYRCRALLLVELCSRLRRTPASVLEQECLRLEEERDNWANSAAMFARDGDYWKQRARSVEGMRDSLVIKLNQRVQEARRWARRLWSINESMAQQLGIEADMDMRHAVLNEREACARIAENMPKAWNLDAPSPQERIALAIRLRGMYVEDVK